MIHITQGGDFDKTLHFLDTMKNRNIESVLNRYGKHGVALLEDATPVDTGLTSQSWDYEIENNSGDYTIYFTNSNENDGVNIAIILQYGHGTRNGGYVEPDDYINPAVKKAFEDMADELWEEVVRA